MDMYMERLAGERLAEIERLEKELSGLPAKWSQDSSLETWFPLTSDELENLRKEVAELRAYKQSAEAKLKEYEKATKLSGKVNAKLMQELLEMQDKVAAIESEDAKNFREVCETFYLDAAAWYEPHILNGDLPASVSESTQIIFEHWVEAKGIKSEPADKPAVAVPDGWRPIGTAPVDGTEFIGLRDTDGKVGNAYRVVRDDCEMWHFAGVTAAVETMPAEKPTHWTPLITSFAQSPRITEQDAREIMNAYIDNKIGVPINEWLTPLLNKLNADRQVPDGWKLVPIEVDKETALSMIISAAKANGLSTEHKPTEQEIENSWKFANAVLSCAPEFKGD